MKRRILLTALCVVFLGVALFSVWQIARQLKNYREGEQAYDALTQYIRLDPLPEETQQTLPSAADPTAPDRTVPVNWQPEADFHALEQLNPDVVGWIYINGTNISYPVVQGRDNSYYLRRLFDGSYNTAGCIFMDYRNAADLSDRNTVIYGHHMKNGTMFQNLSGYKEQAFYDAHPTALLLTPQGNYTVELLAGYITDVESDAWQRSFESDGEYLEWITDAMERSTFVSDVTPAAGDRVLTMSTCTYEYNDARYVVVGILTPAE